MDLSVSTDVILGHSKRGNFDISGSGVSFNGGVGEVSGSYQADNYRKSPSYTLIAGGVSTGIPVNGSSLISDTKVLELTPVSVGGLTIYIPIFSR